MFTLILLLRFHARMDPLVYEYNSVLYTVYTFSISCNSVKFIIFGLLKTISIISLITTREILGLRSRQRKVIKMQCCGSSLHWWSSESLFFYFEAYSELNPTLNFDSDPDPASHLNDSFILSLSSSWILTLMMWIRIRILTLMRIRLFTLIRIRIRLPKMKRDPDPPQNC